MYMGQTGGNNQCENWVYGAFVLYLKIMSGVEQSNDISVVFTVSVGCSD